MLYFHIGAQAGRQAGKDWASKLLVGWQTLVINLLRAHAIASWCLISILALLKFVFFFHIFWSDDAAILAPWKTIKCIWINLQVLNEVPCLAKGLWIIAYTSLKEVCTCRISLNSSTNFWFVCSIMVLAFATSCFWPLNLFMCFAEFDSDQQWNLENDSAKSVCKSL